MELDIRKMHNDICYPYMLSLWTKAILLRVKPSVLRVKPFVLRVKRCHIYNRNL